MVAPGLGVAGGFLEMRRRTEASGVHFTSIAGAVAVP